MRVSLLFLFLSLCFGEFLQAQIVNIPDVNFKNALLNGPVVDTNGDGLPDSDADLNNDGQIQFIEAQAISNLSLSNRNISDLTGIEAFINLIDLECHINNIQTLDFSTNVDLQSIICYNNELTSLNISNCSVLEELDASQNDLEAIDVSTNINLVDLNLSLNDLNSLDVTQNTLLEFLFLANNNISELNVSNNSNMREMSTNLNPIESLDISQMIDLRLLRCDFNNITTLDFSNSPNFEILYATGNNLTSLNLTQNTNLRLLNCGGNFLQSLDLTTNSSLELLECPSNNLVVLELPNENNNVLSFVNCRSNDIVSLNFENNSQLETLLANNNNLRNLNIANGNNASLIDMSAFNNPDLFCIQVDDVNDANAKVCNSNISGWCKDETATYDEFCLLGISQFADNTLQLYPNPTQDFLTIDTNLEYEILQVFDINGRLILEITSSEDDIDVTMLKSGVYFVRLDTYSSSFQFVKE